MKELKTLMNVIITLLLWAVIIGFCYYCFDAGGGCSTRSWPEDSVGPDPVPGPDGWDYYYP